LRLSKEAADLGDKSAQYDYGRFLINQPAENKTAETEACAFSYFIQSAANGSPYAMLVLGKAYFKENC
jgi:TPR repeat protein